jgi:3,4-dihydroxy 2-butanone 4-phosphate synthase/GTP cyclohydrolase II
MTAPLHLAKGNRRKPSVFAPVETALSAIRAGKMIIVVDDEDRDNEGDLTMAASMVTAEHVNFMVKHGRGLLCLSMTPERLDELEIPLEVTANSSPRGTPMCVSIDAKGPGTGVSAADRARTVRVAVAKETKPHDLTRPGHVFPLRSRAGGVLVRAGHTEPRWTWPAAGASPAGMICEMANDDGTMARVPELARFARKHGLLMITIADLIRYTCGPRPVRAWLRRRCRRKRSVHRLWIRESD